MDREAAKRIASHYFDDARGRPIGCGYAACVGNALHFEMRPEVSIGRLTRAMKDPAIEDISLSTLLNHRGEIRYQIVITFKEDIS